MEKMEEYGRMQKFAQAMEEDKELLKKLREKRIKVKNVVCFNLIFRFLNILVVQLNA